MNVIDTYQAAVNAALMHVKRAEKALLFSLEYGRSGHRQDILRLVRDDLESAGHFVDVADDLAGKP